MATEHMIDGLVRDLKPVQRRRAGADALVLALVCAAELTLVFALDVMRPDMDQAVEQPSFWWRLACLGVIAGVGAAVALASFDPAGSPRRGLRWLAALVAASLLAGWLLDAAHQSGGVAGLVARLDWRDGLSCVWQMAALSLPAAVGLGVLMARAAPTDTGGTALSVGIASAAWGALVFVFACPVDDPLYIAVWYAIGCGLVTAAARLLLPPLTRW